MKPILIAILLFAGTVSKSFATDGPAVAPTVLKSFQNTFPHATEVNWIVAQDLYKAVFLLNRQFVTVYYNPDGTMAILTRHIAAASLPVLLQAQLRNSYKNQWVTEVLEVTTEGGLQYFATLENADTITTLRATSTTWSLYQKSRKD